jgi:general secretion pathway protein D
MIRLHHLFAFAFVAGLLGGCAHEHLVPPPLDIPSREDGSSAANNAPPDTLHGARFDPIAPPPRAQRKESQLPVASNSTPVAKITSDISLNFDQMPLPAFVQLVYGEILKRNVQIDPKVSERKDLVTLRAGTVQDAAQVDSIARKVLQSYGVAVIDTDVLVRVVPDSSVAGYLPEIQRGAALPDSPAPLRPQFYLIELTSVRQSDVLGWLKMMFQDRLKLLEDPTRNAILISGAPDTVRSAMEAVRVLDQPIMAGHQSLRITPELWIADDLAKRLFETLISEGYAVQPIGSAGAGSVRYPIILLPVAAVNAIFVFANTQEILDHIQSWVKILDKPNDRGISRNYFVYPARNTDAADLAATLGQLLSGRNAPVVSTAAPPRGGAATSAPAPAAAAATSQSAGGFSGVVVDKASNTLIFQGNAEDYPQVRGLLNILDRPPREALIEVTVAEVDLTGNWQYGIDWSFSGTYKNGNTYTGSTVTGGAVAAGTSGFSYQLLGAAGQVRAAFSAIASDNRTTILSSPRIMARNGQSATIQVGQQVPVITSQQTSLAAATTTQTGILQSVEYKDTGVILHVKPVIHSNDQIELEVEQEVSAAQSTSTGVNNSPTFETRKIATNLTLRNGATILLGGLISGNTANGGSGIPFLKDIPVLGSLFQNFNHTNDRTELIILITPYVVNDDYDAQAVTDAFRRQLGPWAEPGSPIVKPAPLPPPALSSQPGAAQQK